MESLSKSYGPVTQNVISENFGQFDSAKIDYSISKVKYEEILPVTPITATSRNIEFLATPSPNFTDLSETVLELTFKLLLKDGNKIPEAHPPPEEGKTTPKEYRGCGTINYPAASIFRGE